MSCAELMFHQTLSSGFPSYHQRSFTDVYYSNYSNSAIGSGGFGSGGGRGDGEDDNGTAGTSTAAVSACGSDYSNNAQVGVGNVRMLQTLGGGASPPSSSIQSASSNASSATTSSATASQSLPPSVLPPSEFSSAPSSSLSLGGVSGVGIGGGGGCSTSPLGQHHQQQLNRGSSSRLEHHLPLPVPQHHHQPASLSPLPAGVQNRSSATTSSVIPADANNTAAATNTSLALSSPLSSSSPRPSSSSLSKTSPQLAPGPSATSSTTCLASSDAGSGGSSGLARLSLSLGGSYFQAGDSVGLASPASASSGSSAFTSRPAGIGGQQGYNHAGFSSAHPVVSHSLASSSFLFPSYSTTAAASSSSTSPSSPSLSSPPLLSSSSSTLKRSSSELPGGRSGGRDPDDSPAVPKKTRYVTSNCVVLTYHDKETSSEVDDHFCKALSSASGSGGSSATSPCGYGSVGASSSRHSTRGSPPMSQRNFPPSFWDAHHQHHHHHYNPHYPHHHQQYAAAYSSYQAGFQAGGSPASQGAGFLGSSPHDAFYGTLSASPFLSAAGTLGSPALHHHPALSGLHKDPWSGFPFAASATSPHGSKAAPGFNYYPYPRAVTYGPADHAAHSHAAALSAAGYGSMAAASAGSGASLGSGSGSGSGSGFGGGGSSAAASRLSSNYGSLFLPSASAPLQSGVSSGIVPRGTTSGVGVHFPPSATITSAQCAAGGGSGDLGARVTSLTGDHSRTPFGHGTTALDNPVHTAGKDLHWF